MSDLAPGQMGIDDMKMLEQKAQQLAAEAEQDKPKLKEKILFVRFVFCLFILLWKSSGGRSIAILSLGKVLIPLPAFITLIKDN